MVIWFFPQPDLDYEFFKWHDPPYGKFLSTLILDLCNKIWELKAEANVTTNEEHLQEVEEIMPQIEEIARVPMKMMEDYLSSWHVHWQVAQFTAVDSSINL